MDSSGRPTLVTRPTTFTVPLSPSSPLGSKCITSNLNHGKVPGPMHSPHTSSEARDVQYSADQRSQLEQSLKRSVTIVFWYKPNCAPIRLHEEVSTFPLFQLSQFTQLVTDLGLSSTSYVDAFNPRARTWEQQTVSAVCVVESEQRLLFRARKSLLQGLADSECPSLNDEIGMQPDVLAVPTSTLSAKTRKKRAAPDFDQGTALGHPAKYPRPELLFTPHASAGESSQHSADESQIHALPTPTSERSPIGSAASIDQPTAPSSRAARRSYTPRDQFVNFTPPVSAPPAPPAPSAPPAALPSVPLVKRWPNDYTVYELSAGFRQMDVLIAQQPTLTQRAAFERVFGCRYVKSTVCRHRGVWRRAGKELREAYERMGADERAVWTEFLKQVEGGTRRSDVTGRGRPRQAGGAGEMTVVMAPQMAQMGLVPSEPLAASEKPPIMGSLGPPPPDVDEKTLQELHRRAEVSVGRSSSQESSTTPHSPSLARDAAASAETS